MTSYRRNTVSFPTDAIKRGTKRRIDCWALFNLGMWGFCVCKNMFPKRYGKEPQKKCRESRTGNNHRGTGSLDRETLGTARRACPVPGWTKHSGQQLSPSCQKEVYSALHVRCVNSPSRTSLHIRWEFLRTFQPSNCPSSKPTAQSCLQAGSGSQLRQNQMQVGDSP